MKVGILLQNRSYTNDSLKIVLTILKNIILNNHWNKALYGAE
jgi:hypothetical protein